MRDALSKPVNGEKSFGEIAAVRGSVVDIEFPDRLPSINSLIRTGVNGSVIIEAAVHLNENQVRGIALNNTAGLFRGEKAWTTGFVTGKIVDKRNPDEKLLKVFIPTPPNPASGTMVIVKESQTRDPGWSIEEALKSVMSVGIIGPEESQ